MKTYRKKPIEIEAIKWDGHNRMDVCNFMEASQREQEMDESDNFIYDRTFGTFDIKTLEGNMTASVGDFIIRGIKGEYYPCKPDIFEASYDNITDQCPGQKVRAKFECEAVNGAPEEKEEDSGSRDVLLRAVVGGEKGNEENEEWSRYTPSGLLTMTITNPPAAAMFEAGKEYYLDITPAE